MVKNKLTIQIPKNPPAVPVKRKGWISEVVVSAWFTVSIGGADGGTDAGSDGSLITGLSDAGLPVMGLMPNGLTVLAVALSISVASCINFLPILLIINLLPTRATM